tara:strand:- start:70 stop:231 length:162 start_codon:yes stop_codon:yes gene_type:complete
MKEYTSIIKIEIGGNNLLAKNKKEYIEKLKDQFMEEYNFELDEEEIINIKSSD